MRIVYRSKEISIEDVDIGSVFEIEGSYYMKVRASDPHREYYNAVSLSDGFIQKFVEDTPVVIVDCEMVICDRSCAL